LDLDCVLLDSQQMWSAVSERLTRKQGGHSAANAQADTTEPAAMNAEAVTHVVTSYSW
jgi:hypothetical protein